MDQAILSMLAPYQCKTEQDYENALKEIMQQIALLGLWRAKFFEHAAFYGGTALRVLYHLDRFSEDLDFSLITSCQDFKLDSYLHAIEIELEAFGFKAEATIKRKTKETAIQSAFLKENTQQHLIHINAPKTIQEKFHGRGNLKIKLEVDTDPPSGFYTEELPLLRPIPFWVKSYCMPDLFAGKISAMLCRQWKSRVKGRDWYDFLWFMQHNTPVRLSHLEKRLRAYDYYHDDQSLTENKLKYMLVEKVKEVDLNLAKDDIIKFIKNPSNIDAWSESLFVAAISELKVCDERTC